MPTAASVALRAAVHDALAADAALVNILGGAKVYDEPPRCGVSLCDARRSAHRGLFRRRRSG